MKILISCSIQPNTSIQCSFYNNKQGIEKLGVLTLDKLAPFLKPSFWYLIKLN